MLLLEDILTKIKNCIDVPYSLGYNLDEDDTDSAIDPVWDCLYKAGLNKECDIANGVSKVVIIPRNSAYVIKTPLFALGIIQKNIMKRMMNIIQIMKMLVLMNIQVPIMKMLR